MTFAEKLQAARQAAGLTQGQAAARIPELSLRTYQGWESGSPPPAWAQGFILLAIRTSPLKPLKRAALTRDSEAGKAMRESRRAEETARDVGRILGKRRGRATSTFEEEKAIDDALFSRPKRPPKT